MSSSTKIGKWKEFDLKMPEIANNEDSEWIAAIMNIDDYDSLVIKNNNDKQIIKNELKTLQKEIPHGWHVIPNGSRVISTVTCKFNNIKMKKVWIDSIVRCKLSGDGFKHCYGHLSSVWAHFNSSDYHIQLITEMLMSVSGDAGGQRVMSYWQKKC